MIPVVAQIESVAAVAAPGVIREPLRQARNTDQPNSSAHAARKAAQAADTPRPAPVTQDNGLRLTVSSDTHEVVATLVDTKTNEVIREIPSEEMQRAAKVIRAIIGQIVDQVG
jgi:flagellar protein FlaG